MQRFKELFLVSTSNVKLYYVLQTQPPKSPFPEVYRVCAQRASSLSATPYSLTGGD